MLMVQRQYFTPEMVRELPDDGLRYETVHGELLVSPAPSLRHQWILRAVFRVLDDYCTANRVGETLWSPADISLAADSLVQPDVFVHPPIADRGASWDELSAPILVVEVLSPSTARADRFTKRRHYQEAGIPVYWIVDGDAHEVEVWAPGATSPIVEQKVLRWAPEGTEVSLKIPLDQLFG